jgi:dTDP-4-amino-4,6-dideoxygalactose transaminase
MLAKNKNGNIILSSPILGEEEKLAICKVIDSGWITMGNRVAEFERAFAQIHNVEDAVAVNSCTAALHLILTALNIRPGDEILVPALTFVATVNAILYVGAVPIFVDIQALDFPHISIEDAEKKITERTKAVIVMHYGGYLTDMELWKSFCDKHNIKIVEDAAHAPAVDGVAKFSDASAFSFFGNKNMSTAEGGMIIAKNKNMLKRIRRLRAHGMTTDTLKRHQGHAFTYDVTMLGFNYRMDEIRSAIGIVQLKRLLDWNKKRNELSNLYRELIIDYTPEIVVPFSSTHKTSAHLMPILLNSNQKRQSIMEYLRNKGIQTSIHYPPLHCFSYYQERFNKKSLPKTEKYCSREISLPLHPLLTEDDIKRVIEALQGAILKRN